MQEKKNNMFIAIAISIGAIVLVSLITSLMLSVVIGLIIGAAVYMAIEKYKAQDKTQHDAPEKTEESIVDVGVESLLASNLALRKVLIPTRLRDSFEQVIDQLLTLLPKANDVSHDSELTWVINRMATVYLPEKSINPYLALSDDARQTEATITAVEEGLEGMRSELSEVEAILVSRKVNEFNAKAKFLKHRFNV